MYLGCALKTGLHAKEASETETRGPGSPRPGFEPPLPRSNRREEVIHGGFSFAVVQQMIPEQVVPPLTDTGGERRLHQACFAVVEA